MRTFLFSSSRAMFSLSSASASFSRGARAVALPIALAALAGCDDAADGTGGSGSTSSTTGTTMSSSSTGQTVHSGDVIDTLDTNAPLYGTVVAGTQTLVEQDRSVAELAADDTVKSFISDGLHPSLDGATGLVVSQPYNTSVATPPGYCRYTLPSGALDGAWGTNGCVEAPFAYMTTIGVQPLPNGGYVALINPQCSNGCNPGEEAFAVFRMDAGGDPDAAFGTDGFQFTTIAPDMTATAFGVQSTGNVVVAGYTGLYQLKLFRIHADGTLDTTFAGDGILDQDVAGGSFLRILGDDSILILGTTNGVYRVEKYTKDGAADAAFGTAGRVDLSVLTDSMFDNDLTPRGFTVDAMGRVYVVGTRADVKDGPAIPFVLRLSPTGQLDASFGNAGTAKIPGPTDAAYEEAYGIGLDAAGNVLVGLATKSFKPSIVRLAP